MFSRLARFLLPALLADGVSGENLIPFSSWKAIFNLPGNGVRALPTGAIVFSPILCDRR